MLLETSPLHQYISCDHLPFISRLLHLLPGLKEHYCSRGRTGGFVERLQEGTYLGHVTEHVFLELQNQSGIGTEYGKTMTVSDGVVEIICEYRCRQAAEILAEAAVAAVLSAVNGEYFNVGEILAKAKALAVEYMPGPSTASILTAARRRGIPVLPLADGTSLFRLGTGAFQKKVMASLSEGTSCIAVDIACNKQLTKQLLAEYGLPVPCGKLVKTVEEAQAAAHTLGFPLAMKPDNGNQGKGVSLDLNSPDEVSQAFKTASAYSTGVIVEKYLPGRHYRLLVVNSELVAASERFPAHVVGDGSKNIRQLIADANLDPCRGEGHEKPLTKIVVDNITETVLAKQKLTLDCRPLPGQRVWLRENANLSTGGTAVDVTDEVHPLQSELAVLAVRVTGLDIAGVDLVMQDITAPPTGQVGGIIEVNAAPGLRMHLFPAKGKKRDIGQKIIDMLFPPGRLFRVPVISITGTNGKTTTTRMIDYVLRKHGLVTGMSCTSGIYIGGKRIQQGDLTGPASARVVLAHPDVEAAVLETARGGIIRRGLGYDRADVAVITNIREDHIGQDGIETVDDLLHIKSLVAEAVYPSGTVVLNADETHVHALISRIWTNIIFISTKNESITVRRHLGKDGRAIFIRRGTILAAKGNRAFVVGRVRDFAVTLGGRAGHQTENLLCALAACWAYGLTPRQAGAYLRGFALTPGDNPGRANLYDFGKYRVMIDYGHNADGIAKIGELVRKLQPGRSICVLGAPGDRSDELLIKAGSTAARYFNTIIIKEDDDLRGRAPGETATLLAKGALSTGMDKQRLLFVREERTAVQQALSMTQPGDLVVIFYEEIERVLHEVMSHQGSISIQSLENGRCSENISKPALFR
jgi:cyanophycin synthetase